jgi:hypothetical protein
MTTGVLSATGVGRYGGPSREFRRNLVLTHAVRACPREKRAAIGSLWMGEYTLKVGSLSMDEQPETVWGRPPAGRALLQPVIEATLTIRRERVTEVLPVWKEGVQPARRLGNRYAVVERCVRVRQFARFGPALAVQPIRVVTKEQLRLPKFVEPQVGAVARRHLGMIRIKSAEMEEPARRIRRRDCALADPYRTLREVPVRDVDPDLTVHVEVLDEPKGEVQPALVEVDATVDRTHAKVVDALLPPAQELSGCAASAHADDTRIENTSPMKHEIAIQAVGRNRWLEGVRSDCQSVPLHAIEKCSEIRKCEDVRIEIERALGFVEHSCQEVRLERDCEFARGRTEREVAEVRNAELRGAHQGERFAGWLERPLDLVCKRDDEPRVGMVTVK